MVAGQARLWLMAEPGEPVYINPNQQSRP